MVQLFVAVTDQSWFDALSASSPHDEVNFWQPSGNRVFRALRAGELFLFKLHSPNDFIAGGGIFVHASNVPLSLAWEAFGVKNGVASLGDMRTRIAHYRRDPTILDARHDPLVGCRIVTQPVFWPREQWIKVPASWSPNIVTGKGFDTDNVDGQYLWQAASERFSQPEIAGPVERFGRPALIMPRLGQGAFRLSVTDSYERRCAVTGEKTLPILDAAHIQSYAAGGEHVTSNGILLRTDIHRLFDLGYVAVGTKGHFEVSSRLKADFDNGRHYYDLQGTAVRPPKMKEAFPSAAALTGIAIIAISGRSMDQASPDALMRLAAVEHLNSVSAGGVLSSDDLKAGFIFEGSRMPLINPQRGIFKPVAMRYLLSVRTVYPVTGRKVWYDDQRQVHAQIERGEELIDYAFMGNDPNAADNRWLREAHDAGVPILYLLGVAPQRYTLVWPTFVVDWSAAELKARLAFGAPINKAATLMVPAAPERRYALRLVRQRLHQATFREAVLAAYDNRCAISGLPEPRLLDAAHIVADVDEKMGQPIVTNGLPLSKLHHAAFDANLIGIDPDFRIHISAVLLSMNDGPMFEQGIKAIDGRMIRMPGRDRDNPDRDRLAERFALFAART